MMHQFTQRYDMEKKIITVLTCICHVTTVNMWKCRAFLLENLVKRKGIPCFENLSVSTIFLFKKPNATANTGRHADMLHVALLQEIMILLTCTRDVDRTKVHSLPVDNDPSSRYDTRAHCTALEKLLVGTAFHEFSRQACSRSSGAIVVAVTQAIIPAGEYFSETTHVTLVKKRKCLVSWYGIVDPRNSKPTALWNCSLYDYMRFSWSPWGRGVHFKLRLVKIAAGFHKVCTTSIDSSILFDQLALQHW